MLIIEGFLINPCIFAFLAVAYYLTGRFILKSHFSLTTYLTSIASVLTPCLGIYCFAVFNFSSAKYRPVAYWLSIIGMILCLIAFIALFCLYIKKRATIPSVKGVITDVLFSLSMFIPIFECIIIVDYLISRSLF